MQRISSTISLKIRDWYNRIKTVFIIMCIKKILLQKRFNQRIELTKKKFGYISLESIVASQYMYHSFEKKFMPKKIHTNKSD